VYRLRHSPVNINALHSLVIEQLNNNQTF